MGTLTVIKRALKLKEHDVIVDGPTLLKFLDILADVTDEAIAQGDRSVGLTVALLDLRDECLKLEATVR